MHSSLPLSVHFPHISQLSLGCMNLGGWDKNAIDAGDIQQTQALVETALELGINFFDHADIYTHGRAEQCFGEVLKANPDLRSQMYIQSKCGIRFADEQGPGRYDFSCDWILQSVDNSLQRLNTDHLDILLLHRPDPLMQPEEVAEAFSRLQYIGKVKHFGVSNMHQHQIQLLQHYLGEPLVVNQLELSLGHLHWLDEVISVNQDANSSVGMPSGTLDYCRLQGIQLQAWSSLARGIYSGAQLDAPTAAQQQTIEVVAQLAAEYQISKEAIVLAFLLRHPAQIQPIIGTSSVERLRACAQAEQVQLSREHWYQLYVTSRGAPVP